MLFFYYKKYISGSAFLKVCLLFTMGVSQTACVKQQYISEPIDTRLNHENIIVKDHSSQEFKSFLEQHQYPTNNWPITEWDLKGLTLAGVYFNPEINVALSELEVQRAGELIAGQRANPSVGIPLENYSGSADSPWLIGLVFDFLFERKEKRDAVMQLAIAKTNAAEIKLHQQIWTIYNSLHRNLIEYFAARKQKEMLQAQQVLLQDNLELLTRRKELGQVSQFELSRVRLELQHVQLQLSDQDYLINNTFHNLIAKTGLQVDKFDKDNFRFESIEKNLAAIEKDEKQLREELLNNRYDIRVKLKEYESHEAALKLEILKQYPDITLSPGFIFDQGSNVWALGASWVLPLFHNHEGEIEQALAKRKQLQAEFIALQTSLINELNRKNQNYIDKMASYNNSLSLLTELEQRFNLIQKQFDLGYSDKLSLIQVKLEVEKVKKAIFSIKVGVLKAAEELERITQRPFYDGGIINKVTETL